MPKQIPDIEVNVKVTKRISYRWLPILILAPMALGFAIGSILSVHQLSDRLAPSYRLEATVPEERTPVYNEHGELMPLVPDVTIREEK